MNRRVDKTKSNGWSWRDFLPVILALPLAILVKIFIFTTYHVPTASMVPSIIPGDHIVVEKWVFGARFFIKNKPYRLPGWRSIQRGDILVFNVPKEDSIFRQRRDVNFYNWKHSQAAAPTTDIKKDSFMFMPVPGRTPFVKRVIGLPGDKFQYSNYTLLVNGRIAPQLNNNVQHYEIHFRYEHDYDRYKDTLYQIGEHIQMNKSDRMISGIFHKAELDFIQSATIRKTLIIHFPHPEQIPNDFTWARTLAESEIPISIPYKGWTVPVDSTFLQQYGQLLHRFEGFQGIIGDHRLIDARNKNIKEYTFRQNYYWAMGDNRPYSVDSRAWGLIPEDHVIGITRRTFWSKVPEQSFRKGFRWNRLWHRL